MRVNYGRVVRWHNRMAIVVGCDGHEVWLWLGAWSVGVVPAKLRDCSATSKLVACAPWDVS